MHEPLDEYICLEGYGPGASAVIVTCEAGRKMPRTSARALFRTHGGRLGATGSVSYLFRPVAVLRVKSDARLPARAAELGVEEVVAETAGTADLLMDPAERSRIASELTRLGHECVAQGSGWRAMHQVSPSLAERNRLEDLARELAALEGAGHVYTNAQATHQLLAPV